MRLLNAGNIFVHCRIGRDGLLPSLFSDRRCHSNLLPLRDHDDHLNLATAGNILDGYGTQGSTSCDRLTRHITLVCYFAQENGTTTPLIFNCPSMYFP